jgi:PqqD family protein of HPr-rel-A system
LTLRWRLAPPGAFEWRQWGDEAVVFVHASGDTHALSAEASALLAALRAQPQAERSAAQWLESAGYDLAAPDDDAAEQLMGHLEAIGLVLRLAP